MAQDFVARGDRLFVEEDYAGAVEAYSEALQADPQNARIYEARANAYLKLEQYPDANADATKALELSPGLAKAYLRKGVALFNMEEYEGAKEAFEAGCQLAPDNTFKQWIRKCDAELEDEAASQPKASAPSPAGPAPMASTSQLQGTTAGAAGATEASSAAAAPAAAPPAASPSGSAPALATGAGPASAPVAELPAAAGTSAAPLAPSAPAECSAKYRHQYYQLANKVTVDVYAKKLRREQVSVEFGESHLLLVIRDTDGNEEYRLDVELYGKVLPAQCRYEVLSTKIEVTMAKADQIQWGSLEKSNKVAAPNYSTPDTEAPRQYPTSYKKQPKDWSKVDAELAELEQKGELDMGDPLNNFFKKIFAQGDEDTRRAMMKSFVESNGTVLSTNWNEVGQKKIECTPPEGMEVRKWEV
ncbi:hypothetical protein GPECTOR_35g843 [Gonium pectorale]|uniref:Protein SGT1 homolog n=1 Tax=Gonium pectorale TaxID=33097 RepID=A0A150GCU8_GONPE|nr:hypothetical protein GPECTOR_35g843 [Gonium pectorale]|eukprot:KXZ47405.1 hypothetical protein GPECTOR_35g843 [Gonium pectorale]